MKGDSENHFKGPVIPFGTMGEHIFRFLRESSQGSASLARKFYREIFLGYALIAGRNLERRHYDCGSRGIGKRGRVRNSENQCKRSVNATQGRKISYSQWQTVQHHCQEETTKFRKPTPRREQSEGSEDLKWRTSSAKRKGLNRQTQKMTLKPVPTSGRFKVTSSTVITMNVELNSMCRREETFPTPLKYIDVTRSTHTDRIDDYRNVDSNRSLSDSWQGFTKNHSKERKTSQGMYVVRGETDKNSNDYETR